MKANCRVQRWGFPSSSSLCCRQKLRIHTLRGGLASTLVDQQVLAPELRHQPRMPHLPRVSEEDRRHRPCVDRLRVLSLAISFSLPLPMVHRAVVRRGINPLGWGRGPPNDSGRTRPQTFSYSQQICNLGCLVSSLVVFYRQSNRGSFHHLHSG